MSTDGSLTRAQRPAGSSTRTVGLYPLLLCGCRRWARWVSPSPCLPFTAVGPATSTTRHAHTAGTRVRLASTCTYAQRSRRIGWEEEKHRRGRRMMSSDPHRPAGETEQSELQERRFSWLAGRWSHGVDVCGGVVCVTHVVTCTHTHIV
jgi:hypothetical protein